MKKVRNILAAVIYACFIREAREIVPAPRLVGKLTPKKNIFFEGHTLAGMEELDPPM